jgi:hypothetical protein
MMLRAVLAAALALGAPQETASDVASAVLKYARSADEAAFMLSWAEHESHFSARIIACECERWECDHGHARGAWQLHRGAAGADWAALPGNIDAQARAASRMARWSLRACEGNARCAFRLLGGLRVDVPLKGEESRIASYRRVQRML